MQFKVELRATADVTCELKVEASTPEEAHQKFVDLITFKPEYFKWKVQTIKYLELGLPEEIKEEFVTDSEGRKIPKDHVMHLVTSGNIEKGDAFVHKPPPGFKANIFQSEFVPEGWVGHPIDKFPLNFYRKKDPDKSD